MGELGTIAMIVMRMSGGIGNQLFQYAAGRAVATRYGMPLVLDLAGYVGRPDPGRPTRTFDLGIYELRARYGPRHAAGRLADTLLRPHWHESWAHDRPLAVKPGRHGLVMYGYFQSPAWFEEIESELRRDLTHRAGTIPGSGAAQDRVCVQVRRSDYTMDPVTHAVHGTCSRAYYQKAWELLSRLHGTAEVWVFTDDAPWAAAELAFMKPSRIDGDDPTPGGYARKFERMRACTHFIIANSSYGWWAAWLGATAQSAVVAPRFWKPRIATSDIRLLIPGWLAVDNT